MSPNSLIILRMRRRPWRRNLMLIRSNWASSSTKSRMHRSLTTMNSRSLWKSRPKRRRSMINWQNSPRTRLLKKRNSNNCMNLNISLRIRLRSKKPISRNNWFHKLLPLLPKRRIKSKQLSLIKKWKLNKLNLINQRLPWPRLSLKKLLLRKNWLMRPSQRGILTNYWIN